MQAISLASTPHPPCWTYQPWQFHFNLSVNAVSFFHFFVCLFFPIVLDYSPILCCQTNHGTFNTYSVSSWILWHGRMEVNVIPWRTFSVLKLIKSKNNYWVLILFCDFIFKFWKVAVNSEKLIWGKNSVDVFWTCLGVQYTISTA